MPSLWTDGGENHIVFLCLYYNAITPSTTSVRRVLVVFVRLAERRLKMTPKLLNRLKTPVKGPSTLNAPHLTQICAPFSYPRSASDLLRVFRDSLSYIYSKEHLPLVVYPSKRVN